jgi:hypothetical protein
MGAENEGEGKQEVDQRLIGLDGNRIYRVSVPSIY